MFALMLYMNSRNEKKLAESSSASMKLKRAISINFFFLKKWLLERKPSEWIAISLLQQSARPSN